MNISRLFFDEVARQAQCGDKTTKAVNHLVEASKLVNLVSLWTN